MDSIDRNLMQLRINLRNKGKLIIDDLFDIYIPRNRPKKSKLKCIFCGSANNITKEHVLPRWVFRNDPQKFFTTNINKLSQTYNQTTVPACVVCNSEILSGLERYLDKRLEKLRNADEKVLLDDLERIIRWFEIVEYKFQVLNLMRRFIKYKGDPFIRALANVPISMLRHDAEPPEVLRQIRRSQKRISTKNKSDRFNSLVAFRSKNANFHFFHRMDDFIFFELPNHKCVYFYFYNRTFKDVLEAHDEAMKLIKIHY
jgi:hypothetical protein